VGDREIEHDTVPAPILGDVSDAVGDGVLRRMQRDALTVSSRISPVSAG